MPKTQDPVINVPFSKFATPVQASPPRAKGAVSVSAKAVGGKSCLDGLRQAGSLKLMFPRNAAADLQAVAVNTAGGVTGGDRFSLQAAAAANTELTLTTQAAERAYRAQPGETGQISNRLEIGANARLNWLPQETILFQSSALDRHLDIRMNKTGQLLMCEPLVFGRAAMGETLTDIKLHDRISITRGGQPLFLDVVRFSGDLATHLAQPAIAAGAGALATLLFVHPGAEAHLAPLRAALGPTAGVSLIREHVLFARLLAVDSFELRKTLIPILTRLCGGPLPRPWMM